MQEKNLFTIDEAARYLRVSRSFVYSPLIESGDLMPVHLSPRVVRIPRRALEEYVQGLSVAAATEPRRSADQHGGENALDAEGPELRLLDAAAAVSAGRA